MKNKDFDIPLFIKHTDMNIYMHKSTVTQKLVQRSITFLFNKTKMNVKKEIALKSIEIFYCNPY